MPAEAISPDRVAAIYRRETEIFHERRPRSAERLTRAKWHMPNGVPCAWMDVAKLKASKVATINLFMSTGCFL